MKANNTQDEKLMIEINQLRQKNSNLQVVANASMATSGYIKNKAVELGYDSRKELSELEYIVSLAEVNNKP
jgi:hypothetical protein